MSEIFAMHRDLGGMFEERIYQEELVRRLGPSAAVQVPVHVCHGTFEKTYFLDFLVADGMVLELKAVEALHARHRAQLLNYLFLLDLGHGKLVNLRTTSVEHEFVNTGWTSADRRRFVVDKAGWDPSVPGAELFLQTLLELLADWGLGLEISSYMEALAHNLCGAVELPVSGTGEAPLGTQRVCMAHPDTAFRISGFRHPPVGFGNHCQKLLNHLPMKAYLWANITIGRVVLRNFCKRKPTG